MKRMIKVLLILAATVAAVAALAITAGATELKTGIGIVEANGGLRLRSQASTSSDVLSTAHNGDNVVVIRQVGNWYLVNYNLKIGYMHSDYITFKERENIELGYGSVDPYLANIRSGPSTSSGLVDQAGSGAKVFIFGFNCGWYKVKYNGQIGYIRSDVSSVLYPLQIIPSYLFLHHHYQIINLSILNYNIRIIFHIKLFLVCQTPVSISFFPNLNKVLLIQFFVLFFCNFKNCII